MIANGVAVGGGDFSGVAEPLRVDGCGMMKISPSLPDRCALFERLDQTSRNALPSRTQRARDLEISVVWPRRLIYITRVMMNAFYVEIADELPTKKILPNNSTN